MFVVVKLLSWRCSDVLYVAPPWHRDEYSKQNETALPFKMIAGSFKNL